MAARTGTALILTVVALCFLLHAVPGEAEHHAQDEHILMVLEKSVSHPDGRQGKVHDSSTAHESTECIMVGLRMECYQGSQKVGEYDDSSLMPEAAESIWREAAEVMEEAMLEDDDEEMMDVDDIVDSWMIGDDEIAIDSPFVEVAVSKYDEKDTGADAPEAVQKLRKETKKLVKKIAKLDKAVQKTLGQIQNVQQQSEEAEEAEDEEAVQQADKHMAKLVKKAKKLKNAETKLKKQETKLMKVLEEAQDELKETKREKVEAKLNRVMQDKFEMMQKLKHEHPENVEAKIFEHLAQRKGATPEDKSGPEDLFAEPKKPKKLRGSTKGRSAYARL